MNKKPSELILERAGFALSNTVGSSQLEEMMREKEYYMDCPKTILEILKYLDESWEKEQPKKNLGLVCEDIETYGDYI